MKKGEIFCAVVISLAITFTLECLAKRDILGGLTFLVKSPLLFLCNMLIVFASLSLVFFMKKRFFGFAIISTVWIGLGITNFVLQTMRVVPLTSIDFTTVTVDLTLRYVGIIGIFLILIAIIAVLIVLVFVYKKIPYQRQFGRVKTCMMIAAVSFCMLIMSAVGLSVGSNNEDPININEAYEEYGFAFSFARTFVEKGIAEPANYSEETINNIVASTNTETSQNKLSANIIMLQLESFFDMKQIKTLSFSSDPCPVFTHLKQTGISGYLTVPYIGSGTVNSEFEILSGLNIDFFGFGEYPYKSVLQNQQCPTIASLLSEYGYTATAVHDYEGTFYDRHIVYGNLGFDRFVPIEFMCNTEKNTQGWVKDKIFLPYIEQILESSDGPDFIFGVTVQSHGSYPTEFAFDEDDITVSGTLSQFGQLDERKTAEYSYYANEIHEVDTFIGALISYLEAFDEPTVLVLYGDHLPCLSDLDDSDLVSENMFASEYVIWANFDLTGEDRDLEAYQLSAYLMELLGGSNSVVFNYHSSCRNNDDYLSGLEQLAYDILYGENYADAHKKKSDLVIGMDDISVESVTVVGNSVYVKGCGFNEYSVIYVDGFAKKTVFVNSEILMTSGIDPDAADRLTVKQVCSDGYKYN